MEKKEQTLPQRPCRPADLTKEYPLKDAVEILAKFPKAKFDETVELAFRLGVDPTQGDQMVRGTTPLPNGNGQEGPRAGLYRQPEGGLGRRAPTFAGLQDLMQKIQEGWIEFDVAIRHHRGDEGPFAPSHGCWAPRVSCPTRSRGPSPTTFSPASRR